MKKKRTQREKFLGEMAHRAVGTTILRRVASTEFRMVSTEQNLEAPRRRGQTHRHVDNSPRPVQLQLGALIGVDRKEPSKLGDARVRLRECLERLIAQP